MGSAQSYRPAASCTPFARAQPRGLPREYLLQYQATSLLVSSSGGICSVGPENQERRVDDEALVAKRVMLLNDYMTSYIQVPYMYM